MDKTTATRPARQAAGPSPTQPLGQAGPPPPSNSPHSLTPPRPVAAVCCRMVHYLQFISTRTNAKPADIVKLFKSAAHYVKGFGGNVRYLRNLGIQDLAYPFLDQRAGGGKVERHLNARQIALEIDLNPKYIMKLENLVRQDITTLRVTSFKSSSEEKVV